MDFNRLKKTAAETIRRASKTETASEPKADEKAAAADEKAYNEKTDIPAPETVSAPETGGAAAERHADTDDDAPTVSFNLKNVLDRFRKRKDDLDKTFRDIFEVTEEAVKQEENDGEASADAPGDTGSSGGDTGLSGGAADAVISDLTDIKAEMAAVNETLVLMKDNAEYNNRDAQKSIERIMDRFDETYGKLNDISVALGGISKLDTGIFDLKNSLVNMRNTESELQTAFYRLKKKMSVGITLLSIIAFIAIILAVLNLLS